MASATATQVGTYFLQNYYNLLHHNPGVVHQFYREGSTMVRVDDLAGTNTAVNNMMDIRSLIMSFNFTHINIKTANSVNSWSNGLLVMVFGLGQTKEYSHQRKFIQMFFLAPQEKGYFVLNDYFHFVDEEQVQPAPVIAQEDCKSNRAWQVGPYFLQNYYNLLHQNPDVVHQFYSEASTMVQVDNLAGTNTAVNNMIGIHSLIISLSFTQIEIRTANFVDSWGNGLLFMVSGLVRTKAYSHQRKFIQLFFLAPQEKGYFVLNDYFHFVDQELVQPAPVIAQEDYLRNLASNTIVKSGGVQAQESTFLSPQAPEAVEEDLSVEDYKIEPNSKISLPWEGKEIIWDDMVKVDNANLYHGRCEMDLFSTEIMIRKGVEIKRRTYDIMKMFQHDTSIPHLNFYSESGNMGRIAIPRVQSHFCNWIENEGQLLLFDGRGNMSALFKRMIVDLCDLVEKLRGKKIVIKNLHQKNLYIADEITPRILVLVTEAEQQDKDVAKLEVFKPVKDLVECIFKECKVEMNHEAKRYLGFIVTENFTVNGLKRYPHNWNEQMKGDYLFALVAAKPENIRKGMKRTGLKWPLEHGKLPEILDLIITHQRKRNTIYSPKIPYDYIRLIRDTYKHFDKFPPYIKQELGSQNGFIKRIEEWSPDIWKDLYDIIGWP